MASLILGILFVLCFTLLLIILFSKQKSFGSRRLNSVPRPGGLTPVYAAAVQNHFDCVVLLASASPESVRVPTDSGITPLWMAVKKFILQLFGVWQAMRPLNTARPAVTLLAIAQQSGHNRVVRFLESKL